MAANHEGRARQLNELKALLTRARDLAAQLVADPLVERLLQAFAKLPAPDREPVLQVLERDATWCRIVEQTADTTGVSVRPNPHASLYVQVIDHAPTASEPLRRDVEVIRFGIEQFVRMLPLLFQDGVHAQWTTSARELIHDADPALRECAARLAHEVLALLDEAEHVERRASG